MKEAATALRTLYGVSALAGAAAGLFNPLTSALLTQRGVPTLLIGVTQSVFFLCVMLGAPLARWGVRRHGARAVIAAGLLLTAVAALQIPLAGSPQGWMAARAAMGFGLALYMVGGQTSLIALAREDRLGLASAVHALAFGVGLGIGPLAGAILYDVAPLWAFMGGAGLLLLAVPLVLRALPGLRLDAPAPRYGLLRRLGVPLYAVFAYGVAEATLLTMYPVVLLQRGHAVADIGVAFAAFVGGGLLSALPFSYLADRTGREKVLAHLSVAGAASTAALVYADGAMLVVGLSLMAGASLGPVYAIALALTGQRLEPKDLAAASALFTVAFSLGSLIAPWLCAVVMQRYGAEHVFTLTSLLLAGLALRLAAGSPGWREQRA